MLFQTTVGFFLCALMLFQISHAGIISTYNELFTESLRSDLQIMVENGKYSVFNNVLIDYGLDLSSDAEVVLWDYICASKIVNDDTCAAFGSSATVDGNAAFAQLEMYGANTFSGYWDTIPFTSISFNKAITLNTSNSEIKFEIAGVYKCTIGHRGGSPVTDVWNAVRVFGITSGTVGISNGAGNINGGDMVQSTFAFFFQVDDLLDAYLIQKGRIGAQSVTLIDTGDWADGSESPPTLIATIEFLGNP